MKNIRPAYVVLFLLVFFIWLAFCIWNFGLAADKFGALNTLFTGLGFVVVLATLVNQQNQIKSAASDVEKVTREIGELTKAIRTAHETQLELRYVEALKAQIDADATLMKADPNLNTMAIVATRMHHVNAALSSAVRRAAKDARAPDKWL
jgi:cellobiose-specific phosphotransferase system component IIA